MHFHEKWRTKTSNEFKFFKQEFRSTKNVPVYSRPSALNKNTNTQKAIAGTIFNFSQIAELPDFSKNIIFSKNKFRIKSKDDQGGGGARGKNHFPRSTSDRRAGETHPRFA